MFLFFINFDGMGIFLKLLSYLYYYLRSYNIGY